MVSNRLAEALAHIERAAAGPHRYDPKPVDVAALRKRLGMTQTLFAKRFGFPVATLRHWERGDRKPRGAALVLLNVLERKSRVVADALSFLR